MAHPIQKAKVAVVHSKSHSRLVRDPKAWRIVFTYLGSEIPKSIPLTTRAINHWNKTKNELNYASFKTLRKNDIISVISAAKRGEVIANVNRFGYVILYKLLKVGKN